MSTNRRDLEHMHGLSRRAFMRGAAGAAALPLILRAGPAAALAGVHTFKLGAFEITVVSDGLLTMPLRMALPGREPAEVEAELTAAQLPTDAITAQVNVTLIKTPDALVLIDTGGGTEFLPGLGKFPDALEAAGIAADKVTHVVFTHAHADHLWGVIDGFEATRYANARHLMTAAERDFWMTPGRDAQVPDMFKSMAVGTARRLKMIADRLETMKIGAEIVPGVEIVDSGGHTPGHVSIMVRSGAEHLLVLGDALTHPHVSFARPDWRWGSDMDSDRAVATRKNLLDRLATDKASLLGYHLPWPGVGRVERKDQAYRLVM